MAVVYRAQDEKLRREVAVKVLHPHLLAEPESKARLEREAQAVAKLQHDNILQVFDYSGGDSPSSFIVTEFIDGQTLKQFLANRKLPLPEVAALIVLEVGLALQHAHSLGIIHRDIKPENVMVRKDGLLKLMDFGVAQVLDLERMTVTGQLLGSPAYMAPEIFEGKPLDVRTDVFSVGVMLYQMAAGQLPFSGRNPHEVLKRIAEGRFPDPRTVNRLISDRLARIIARALAKKPDDRYPTITAVVDDLRAFLADAGLENARDELRRYFTAAAGYEEELPRRIVAALVETGRRAKDEKRLARALDCWNRALALDPKNPDVARELKRLEGRRRVRNTTVVAGGAALLGGLIWGAFRIAAHEDVPAPLAKAMAPAAAKKPSAEARAKTPANPPPVDRTLAKKDRAEAVVKKPHPAQARKALPPPLPHEDSALAAAPADPPPAPAKNVEIKHFTVGPKLNMTFQLDDGPENAYGPDHKTVDVPWEGLHHITFRSPCCKEKVVDVGPAASKPLTGTQIMAPFEPNIGQLRLQLAQPADARIEIRDITETAKPWKPPIAKPNEDIEVPFDDMSTLRRSLQISVYRGDRSLVGTKTVEVYAGQKKTVRLD